MTIAKGDPADPAPATAPPARRSHVPNDGSGEAAAIERARKEMLHEGRELKRTRIGAGQGYLLGRPTDRPSTAPIDLDGLGRGTDWLADTLRAMPT